MIGGAPVEAHMRALARKGRKRRIRPPSLPPSMVLVWRTFVELHHTRGSYGTSIAPIIFQEIDAWQRVRATRLLPWELDALLRLDAAYLKFVDESTKP